MKQVKEVTMHEVAQKARVSTATVSRAFSKTSQINKKTQRKVLQAATELGYRMNHFARNLRNLQTNTIGVIVHELRSYFIISVLAGIEKVATKAGYDLLITHSTENLEKERANVRNLYDKRVDGVIASLSFETKDLEHFKLFREKKIPLVFFDRVEDDDTNSVVIIDNYKCGYAATKHLIEQGCKNIALVTSSLNRNVYSERCRGYKDALENCNIGSVSTRIIISDLKEESAINAANELMRLDPMPDGVFVTNDFIAAIIMKTLKQNDYKIPEDIAIVGFNNDSISRLVEPALTTINYPGEEIGKIAATQLLNYLNGNDSLELPQKLIAHSGLIVRESSLHRRSLDN